MQVDVRVADGRARVTVVGELDLANQGQFSAALGRARDAASNVLVDLAGVTFMDSSAMNALLSASEASRVAGHAFAVVGATPPVRRLFELVGFGHMLSAEE